MQYKAVRALGHAVYILAFLMIAGCRTPQYLKETGRLKLTVDTEPTGAEVYQRVPGGAWVATGSTPIDFVLDLRHTDKWYGTRLRTVGCVNITAVDNHRTEALPRERDDWPRHAGRGLWLRNWASLSFRMQFRKPGYDSLDISGGDPIRAEALWRQPDGIYKLTYPLCRLPDSPKKAAARASETVATDRKLFGLVFSLRVVAIPSAKVASATTTSASGRSDVLPALKSTWSTLRSRIDDLEGKRVSVFGIADFDDETKKRNVGRFATEMLYPVISDTEKVVLLERSLVGEFLKEQNLTLKDVVDNPKSLEKMSGVDYVILGSVFWVDK